MAKIEFTFKQEIKRDKQFNIGGETSILKIKLDEEPDMFVMHSLLRRAALAFGYCEDNVDDAIIADAESLHRDEPTD